MFVVVVQVANVVCIVRDAENILIRTVGFVALLNYAGFTLASA